MDTKSIMPRLSVFFIFLSITLSCNKTNKEHPTVQIKTDQEIITTYSKIGEFHNRSLDYLYTEIKKIADSKTKNGRTEDVAILTLLELNQKAEAYLKDSLGFSSLNIVPYYNTDTSYGNPEHLYQTTTFTEHYADVFDESMATDLSTSVNDLETVFRNDRDPLAFQKYDSLIQVKVPLITNQNDKASFVGCASVIKNSYQYWSKNHLKWEALIDQLYGLEKSNLTARKSLDDILKDMVWADGSGALAGLIRGAIIGAAGGTVTIPGIGTVTGAAVGGLAGGFVGGAVGSGGAALNGLIQWLVNW